MKLICEVDQTEAFPSGIDPMGAISGGRLVLTGSLKPSAPRVHTVDYADLEYFPRGFADWYDCPRKQSNVAERGRVFHFGVGYLEDKRRILGLILQAMDVPGQYLRIGMFVHPFQWKDGFRDMSRLVGQSPVVQEDFPGFADFDPENFERRIVTII